MNIKSGFLSVLFFFGLKYGVATLISGVFFLQAVCRSKIIF
jgi:hypothetical protein